MVVLRGFYSHAGTSYASKSFLEASDYLTAEVCTVLGAVQIARANFPTSKIPPLVLSVGSTQQFTLSLGRPYLVFKLN